MRQLILDECNKLIYQVGLRAAAAGKPFVAHMTFIEKTKVIGDPDPDTLSGFVIQRFVAIANLLKARIENAPAVLEKAEYAVIQARLELESSLQKPLHRDWKEDITAALKEFDVAMIFARSDDVNITLAAAITEVEKGGQAR